MKTASGLFEMAFPIRECWRAAWCLRCVPDQSGGEPARTPNAARGSKTPGSREAFGLRVALAPLSEEARQTTPKLNEENLRKA
jgi:hypothetical protein